MAPPIAGNSWLSGRHFGIVIDAGSSGSRLQIYSWKDPRSMHVEKGSTLAYTLPKVEKGTQDNDLWVSKVEPGLSSLADNPEDVGAYLRPLLSHARDHIPPSLQKDTPLFLLATAGMRLLSPKKQGEILLETCRFLVTHSHFKIEDPSAVGPCGSSVRIITGEEEGLFGWIAVNYLMDGFTGSRQDRTTYGFLDMGGASTQIAFEPSLEHQAKTNDLIDVRLRLLGGEEIHHKVFVTTWLGYGTNQARERYVGKAVTEYDSILGLDEDADKEHHLIPDPCLPKDLELQELPVHSSNPATAHLKESHRMVGTGSFEQCMKKTAPLLNTTAPCPDSPCLMNGVHVPPIDFSVSHFIGVSEYWYSSEHIFGLGGAYDFVQYERAASEFCSRDWAGILKEHEESRIRHRLGGDGEVVQDGKVVEAGQWGPQVELPRLQMQCFKAAWLANVLHEGIKMPRLVDPGGNETTKGEKVADEATKKGLGRPTFQSVDTVGDIAISWTLGKMVLEASKEVPPLVKTTRPLVDPIDDIEDIEHFPIQPIRFPSLSLGGIEEIISPHLPSSLSRSSLGFSPVLFLLYVFVIFILLAIVYPMRRRLRSTCLRTVRSVARRDTYSDLLEEGNMLNGGRPPSPTTSSGRWIRRVFSFAQPKSKGPLSIITSNNPVLRHIMPSNARSSPTRSFTMPTTFTSTATSTQYVSRSPSPGPGFVDDTLAAQTSLMSSRSRNASQINLSRTRADLRYIVVRDLADIRRTMGNSQYRNVDAMHPENGRQAWTDLDRPLGTATTELASLAPSISKWLMSTRQELKFPTYSMNYAAPRSSMTKRSTDAGELAD
ncbi:nucleoside phosphatase family-domain-containing protein [Flammula alnicola]|nr:nucleoside phosphatase family-domain-containing protein [Flammula alnicola]